MTQDERIGGHPILDFINTVKDSDKTRSQSSIADWPLFMQWIELSELFDETERNKLRSLSEPEASFLLSQVHDVREEIYHTLLDTITNESNLAVRASSCQNIQSAIQRASFVRSEDTYSWRVELNDKSWLVDSLYLALEHLLRSANLKKLKQCGRCTWLFLDTGRGRRRRWCKMSTCGNREKSKYFRERKASI